MLFCCRIFLGRQDRKIGIPIIAEMRGLGLVCVLVIKCGLPLLEFAIARIHRHKFECHLLCEANVSGKNNLNSL